MSRINARCAKREVFTDITSPDLVIWDSRF